MISTSTESGFVILAGQNKRGKENSFSKGLGWYFCYPNTPSVSMISWSGVFTEDLAFFLLQTGTR